MVTQGSDPTPVQSSLKKGYSKIMDNIISSLNGKNISYSPGSTFLVQVGRGSKGSYKTSCSLADLSRAVFYFNCINIGRGYKKRLVLVDERSFEGRRVLARAAS